MLFALETTASMSFAEMAKKNPTAFVDLIDTADPAAVNQIIRIIEGMILETETKKGEIAQELSDKVAELTNGKLDAGNQEEKCNIIGANLTAKETLLGEAQGKYQKASSHRDEREPVLNKELQTLGDVLNKVRTLQTTSGNTGRRLLALDSEIGAPSVVEDPQSLLESLVDADPAKVNRVIELLQILISQASSEKDSIIGSYTSTKKEMDEAQRVVDLLQIDHNVCKSKLNGANTNVQNLEAEVAQLTADTQKWTEQMNLEIGVMKEIITLLEGTKA